MSEELTKAGEDFGTLGLLRQNAGRWGFAKAGYLSVDPIASPQASRLGFRVCYACDYCSCLVVVSVAGPFGERCSLVTHALHCAAVTFGIRYIRAHRQVEEVTELDGM